MNIARFLPTAILRNQRITLLFLFLIFLLTIFRLQDNASSPVLFQDSVSYCNAPFKSRLLDNRSNSFTEFNLIQIQVLIRHGDRAPIELNALPNTAPVRISCIFNTSRYFHTRDLHKLKSVAEKKIFQVKGSKKGSIIDERATCNGGQLTPSGYTQHLLLGKSFRMVYDSLLGEINIVSDVHVQATDHHRTIQSAASFLTGAFYEQLLVKTPEVVINVHRDRVTHGHFLLDETGKDLPCPVLSERNEGMLESRSVKFFSRNVDSMVTKMAGYLLVPRKAMPPFNRIVDVLFARLCHGQGVPLGPHLRLPHSMVKQALQFSHMYVRVHHDGIAELQTLSLLSQIAQRFLDLVRNAAGAKKFVLYSAHDTTVAPFLQILNVWDGKWPPYASNVFVEFYRKKDLTDVSSKGQIMSSYFRIVYNGVAMSHTGHLGFCKTPLKNGELCSVSDLLRYVSNNADINQLLDVINERTFADQLLFTRIKSICSKK